MSHPKKMRTQLSSVNDVVSEILTRLPVKSIIRFRCVSKSWNSIITDPIFITTHFNQAKSLSKNSHNGYLLYTKETEDSSSHKELCIDVCNRDRTLTHISRFQISFSHVRMVGFCNGMFCLRNYDNNVLYLWNPSIREFKMLDPTCFCFPFTSGSVTIGFAYHSQTNDFKILRIVTYKRIEYLVQVPPAETEVYTLSTDSWRKAVISPEIEPFFRSFVEPTHLFFNGALHSLAYCRERSFSSHKCILSHSHKCILSFDVNDERFHKIMLPQNYSSMGKIERLAVFKGSLALIVCCDDGPDGDETDDNMDICHIWVMREYGVVESWTKISVPIDCAEKFFCCTDSGELLIEAYEDRNLVSFDPESLNSNNLGIESPHWLVYTADLMQSLVLLDQHNKAEKEPNNPLSPERNPREATNTSSDARPLRVKYPSLPSWEVQVTNDSGEGETLIVPRSKHVPYVPWTGGLVEVDFVEECYSLIGSIKNWIWSSSQSSFARQNKLSHEIDLLRNRVESQASIIRTLERCLLSFGPCETEGSSDPRIWSSSQSSFACQNNISHEIDLLNMVESQASTMMSQSRRKPKQLLSRCLLDDVVYDILSRLPVKSLTRFRCVSKSWNSIITNAIFIKTHFDRAKSLSNNNGYLLYVPAREDYLHFLCTVVCNSDHTLTLISSFKIPFSDVRMVGFCNGMFCLHNYHTNVLYLWNPSIRKFKMLSTTRFCFPSSTGCVTHGLVYHSQSNDFKILRIVCYERIGGKQRTSAEAEVYTLSTDSWRRVVISVNSLSVSRPIGSVDYMYRSPCLFFNGALLSIASFRGHKFILSFDVNDERFYEIMLPQKYLDKVGLECERLVVFNGSLALLVLCDDIAANKDICHMWVMREYGAVESWTKENVLVDSVEGFFGCTDSGELLIHTLHRGLISYDPESLNENNLGIQYPHWLSYTADFMESLVLLDQHDEAEMEHDTPPFPKRNSREATNTSSDARFLRVKYPSLPSGEVLVTNDSGEGESLLVPRSKHVPYVPWTGGLVEVDFVEECCSLIESMKNWIWSSSQSSFARQNKLSHEIDLLQNRVESQASTIRTLERCLWSFGPREAGGSSDPIPDAAGVTPLADEGNPMNTTVQSKDGSSRCVTRLAP